MLSRSETSSRILVTAAARAKNVVRPDDAFHPRQMGGQLATVAAAAAGGSAGGDRYLTVLAHGGDNLDWSAIGGLAAKDAGEVPAEPAVVSP